MGRPSVRHLVVDAGLELFLRSGFNASSVQDITNEAGVPKGSFYNHFESKEALAAEIVDLYADGGERRIALRNTALAPLVRLRRHFEGLNKMYLEARCTRGCLLGNFSAEVSDQSEMIRVRLIALFSQWTTEMEEVISLAQANGEVSREFKASDLAAFLLDAYEGAILRSRVEKSGAPFERFMQIAFKGILAP